MPKEELCASCFLTYIEEERQAEIAREKAKASDRELKRREKVAVANKERKQRDAVARANKARKS